MPVLCFSIHNFAMKITSPWYVLSFTELNELLNSEPRNFSNGISVYTHTLVHSSLPETATGNDLKAF